MKEIKKVLIGLVSIIVLLVVADWAVGTWSEKMYFKSKYSIFRRQIYCLNESDDDILIFGSSRAAHHYILSILSDSLGMSCYNAGSDGECIYYHYTLFASMIERGARPKFVVLDVIPQDIYESTSSSFRLEDAIERLSPHYDEFASVKELYSLLGWKERIKMCSRAYRYNSKLVQTIRCNYIPTYDELGFEGLDRILDKAHVRKKKQGDEKIIDENKIAYLQRFIQLAQINNIPIVIVESPRYIRYETGLSDLVREISNKSNIPYYNFSDCPDICTPELFNDESHLNINGATLYSMKIADLLKELKL